MSASSKVTFKHSLGSALAADHFREPPPKEAAAAAAASFAARWQLDPLPAAPSFREELVLLSDIQSACEEIETLLRRTPNALLSDEVLNNVAQAALTAMAAGCDRTEPRVAHFAKIEAKKLLPAMRHLAERTAEAGFRTSPVIPTGCVRIGAASWLHRDSMALLHLWQSAASAKRFMKASRRVQAALLDHRILGIYVPYTVMCSVHGQRVTATAVPPLLFQGVPEVRFFPPEHGLAHEQEGGEGAAVKKQSNTSLKREGSFAAWDDGGVENMSNIEDVLVATVGVDSFVDEGPSSMLEVSALQLHAALGLGRDHPLRLRRGGDGRHYFMSLNEVMAATSHAVGSPTPGPSPPTPPPPPSAAAAAPANGGALGALGEVFMMRDEALRHYVSEKATAVPPRQAELHRFIATTLVPRAARNLITTFSQQLVSSERSVGVVLGKGIIPKQLHSAGVGLSQLYLVEEQVRNSDTPNVADLLACLKNEMLARTFGDMACIDLFRGNAEGLDTESDRVDMVNRLATFVATKDMQFWQDHLMPTLRMKFGAPPDYFISPAECHTGVVLRQLSLASGCQFDESRGRFERFADSTRCVSTATRGWLPDEGCVTTTTTTPMDIMNGAHGAGATAVVDRIRREIADSFWAHARAAAGVGRPFLHSALLMRAFAASFDIGRPGDAIAALHALSNDTAVLVVPQTRVEAAREATRELLLNSLRLVALEGVAPEKRLVEVEKVEEVLVKAHEGRYLRSIDCRQFSPNKALPFDSDAMLSVAALANLFQASTRARPTLTHISIMCQSVAALLSSRMYTEFRVNYAATCIIETIEPLVASVDNEATIRSVFVMAEQIGNALVALRCTTEGIRYLERVLWRAIGTPAEAFKATAMMAILIVEKMREWNCHDEFDKCVALYIAALSVMCTISKYKENTVRLSSAEDSAVLTRRQKLRDALRKVMEKIRGVHVDQWEVAATNNVPLTLIYRVEQLLRANDGVVGSEELFGKEAVTVTVTNDSLALGSGSIVSFGESFRRRMTVVFTHDGVELDEESSANLDDGPNTSQQLLLLHSPGEALRAEDRTGRRLATLITNHIRQLAPQFAATVMLQRIGRGLLLGRCRQSPIWCRIDEIKDYLAVERAERAPRCAIEAEFAASLAKLRKKEREEHKLVAKGRRVGSVWSVVAKARLLRAPSQKSAKGDDGGGGTTGSSKRGSRTSSRRSSNTASSPLRSHSSVSEEARKRESQKHQDGRPLERKELVPPLIRHTPPPPPQRHEEEQADEARGFSDDPGAYRFDPRILREPAYMRPKQSQGGGGGGGGGGATGVTATTLSSEREKVSSSTSATARECLWTSRGACPAPPPGAEDLLAAKLPRTRTFTPEPIAVIPDKLETRIYSEAEIRERLRRAEETAHEMFMRRTQNKLPVYSPAAGSRKGPGSSFSPSRSAPRRTHHLRPLAASHETTVGSGAARPAQRERGEATRVDGRSRTTSRALSSLR